MEHLSMEQIIAEKWVNTGEAAEITGYDQRYLQQLAFKNAQLPEDERLIRVQSRARRYEMWLPDLLVYIEKHGHGPRKPVTNK